MTTLTDNARASFDQFYAENFTDEDTVTGLCFGAADPTPPEYREKITGLDRERIFDLWLVFRYRVDIRDREAPGYQKFQLLAELAYFSHLADRLADQGIITEG